MNSWTTILVEVFWDASIIPYGNQNTFSAITAFAADDAPQAIVLAVCGSTLAFIFNWFIGRWMVQHGLSKQPQETQERYSKLQTAAQKYAWLVLLLIWAPLGNYFTLFAGFFKVKLQVMLAVSIPVITAYYVYQAGII